MQHGNRWVIVVLIIVGVNISGCQQQEQQQQAAVPALRDSTSAIDKAEKAGTAILRVRLTARKAEEYGITMAPIREENVSGTVRKVIPSAAVVYDQNGEACLFTSPDSLVFIRQRIRIEYITGELVALLEGPPTGTKIVTRGAQQLSQTDF